MKPVILLNLLSPVLCGLINNKAKFQLADYMIFSFRFSNTTHSMWCVCGNISTG